MLCIKLVNYWDKCTEMHGQQNVKKYLTQVSTLRQTSFLFMTSGFLREVNENCALLRYYAASSGNSLATFRDNLSVPPSRVKNLRPFKDETDRLSRNFGKNLHYSLLRTGIASRSGLDGPVIESRWGARFSAPVQTCPEAHPASYTKSADLSRG